MNFALAGIVRTTGSVVSLFLFLSPIPTFYKIWKAKSVQSFKPDPYLATMLYCAMVFYVMPFVHSESFFFVTINGIGFFIEASYIIIFFLYSERPKRRLILKALLVEFVFMFGVMAIIRLCLHTTTARSFLVSLFCFLLNIMMYASPLTIMSRVMKTKSVKYLPFYLSLAYFANGIVWSSYAVMNNFDLYVLVPNGLGTISGLVQLVLYAAFYSSTNWEDDDDDYEITAPQTELQLNRV